MAAKATETLTYLRVSGRGQVRGDGFPRQREAIARYAKANALTIVGEYRDEGVSGTSELEERDGLSDLLTRIKANGVRVVLVERADRLARDLIVGELILAEFRRHDVRVIAADSGTELTAADGDATRTLIRQVLGAVAQFEKSVLVSKLRAARVRMRRAEGRCEGRKPYGARAGEPETLTVIRALRRSRLSFGAIASRLNEEGRSTRTGAPWHGETVRKIVMRKARAPRRQPAA